MQQTRQNQHDPTQPVVGRMAWVMKFFGPPIFNMYLNFKKYIKNIYYTILLFTFLPLFLDKTQTLSSLHIICVCLVLCLGLFGYKFALFCGGGILMLNLIIIIIVIKKKIQPIGPTQPNPIHVGWVGLCCTPMMGWVGLCWIFVNPSQ